MSAVINCDLLLMLDNIENHKRKRVAAPMYVDAILLVAVT